MNKMFKTSIKDLMSQNLPIKLPRELLQPLVIKSSLLMTPGPTNVHERVTSAISLPVVSHVDPQFLKVLKEVSSGIRYAFQTRNQYSFGVTGSGTCAMEMAICNMLERGDKFLVASHGLWGERVAIIGSKHGFNVIKLPTARLGTVLELDEFERALIKHKPKLLYVCHGDSSSGTLQPLEGLGALCHQHNCLLLVDAVMTLCSTPLLVDQWEIDVVYSGGQKALSGPTGVSILSLNSRAIQTIENRKTPVDSYYMDVKIVAAAWGIENHAFPYHYTPAVNLMYGLREALAMVVEEGIHNVVERHVKMSKIVQSQLKDLGMEFLVENEKHRLPCMLTIKIPNNINASQVKQYLYDVHRVSISLGLGPSMDKVWRIGILGVNANAKSVNTLCTGFKDAIQHVQQQLISKL